MYGFVDLYIDYMGSAVEHTHLFYYFVGDMFVLICSNHYGKRAWFFLHFVKNEWYKTANCHVLTIIENFSCDVIWWCKDDVISWAGENYDDIIMHWSE